MRIAYGVILAGRRRTALEDCNARLGVVRGLLTGSKGVMRDDAR